MEYNPAKKEIKLDRVLSNLDKFVLDFVRILERHLDYVIVSGYVSILFGRSRTTEDIDLLVKINEKKFSEFWKEITEEFECINTSNYRTALDMLNEHAIRFARKNIPIPNIEFKTMKTSFDRYSYNNRLRVILKEGGLYISQLEMQIAYKLFLGSRKDIEDAKHLYDLFEEKLNKEELHRLIREFKVEDKFNLIKREYEKKRFRKIE